MENNLELLSQNVRSFELLSHTIELSDEPDGVVSLYERHYFQQRKNVNFKVMDKKIEYLTIDESGNKRYWIATKDPEKLTREERHRILNYCLSSFDDDEIVNYHDLFIHGEFIKEVTKL